MDLILLARSNREIARELGIEERTVKAHVGRLMRKTGAENRIDLSMRALRTDCCHSDGASAASSTRNWDSSRLRRVRAKVHYLDAVNLRTLVPKR